MKSILAFLLRWKYIVIAVVGVGAVAGVAVSHKSEEPQVAEAAKKTVEVIRVADIQSDGGTIPVVGTLQSFQQLDIRPQMPGQLAAVRVKLGQYVYAGQTLAEVTHRDLDAAVAQASAQVSSATAQLDKMKAGDRTENIAILEQNLAAARQQLEDMQNGARPQELNIAKSNVDAAQDALQTAQLALTQTTQQNAINATKSLNDGLLYVRGTQISLDKILNQDLTVLFDNNNGDRVIPVILKPLKLNEVNDLRADVEFKLKTWEQQTTNLTADEKTVTDAIARSQSELTYFLSFLDKTGDMLQDAAPVQTYDETSIATAKSTVNTARSTVKGMIDAANAQLSAIQQQPLINEQALIAARARVTQAQSALANAQDQYDIAVKGATPEQIRIQEAQVANAEQQLAIAKNGARPEDLRVQEAQVASARASLALAAANRDKALIKAPIAGKVTYLPIKVGDFVSSSSIAVSLASDNGLQVETYVSERERAFLSTGNEATVNETYAASISEIAPALDPVSRKVKVVVTLKDKTLPLTLGETVRVALRKNAAESASLQLPLTAVKFNNNGTQILSVTDGVVAVMPVDIGTVSANTIEVTTPLNADLAIVKDARGLRDGQEVDVK